MKKEGEAWPENREVEGDGNKCVVREVGQSESSAPTMLAKDGRRRGRRWSKMKKEASSSCKKRGGIYDGQHSGAPPFVVPPMKFSIGK